ncbi:ribosome recycling factor [Patescibacteria group bacterium]|nr:ribosome recycling factor [Patescibacteria group bacterium]MBU1074809.1 ribosome recycling factor [Patescibacteria group bacterium]MBU1952416.1 ribosome recycling factor [Patescibacteria group bacterium]
MEYIDEFKLNAEKAIEHLKAELSKIRSGRAMPSLVENIPVECYGNISPLVQLATITAPDHGSLLIQPWDKAVMKEIEKAIYASNIGLSPVNEGQHIRVSIPSLTEEKRLELVKLINERVEAARIAVRNTREIANNDLRTQEKDKTISKDDLFASQKDLQKETDSFIEQIKVIAEKKEKEIMTI